MNIFSLGRRQPDSVTDKLKVFVKTNLGEQLCLSLENNWTVEDIKKDISTKLKTPKERLKIIFAGKELSDSLRICECDLGNQSVLHAVRIEAITLEKKSESQNLFSSSCPSTSVNLEEKSAKSISREENDGHSNILSVEKQQFNINCPRLLCDDSTVLTIQMSEEELKELNKLKVSVDQYNKPHFYVYCISPCASVCIGKLRVRCSVCKEGAITLHRDPTRWSDVLKQKQVSVSCETPGCGGTHAEFFFKCREHETKGEDDTAVVLYMIRANLPGVSCLVCTDVSSPVLVFECERSHVLCLDCFVTYCVSRLNERQFVLDSVIGYTLPCAAGCPDSLIKEVHHFKLVGDHHYNRYQRFGAEEALLAMGGVMCPQPGCGQGILPDQNCRRVKCVGGCEFVFCKDCGQGYHIGECLPNGNSTIVSGSTPFDVDPQRSEFSSWEEASHMTIRGISKPCPNCRTPTERSGGCMHMVCVRASCQFNWCWVCQTEWTRECMAAHWFS